jgi:hypothetical protein
MKSFRFYLRAPVELPARLASDYSAGEVAAFQEKFRPLAERHHRRLRRARFGIGAFLLCVMAAPVLPGQMFVYCGVVGACCVLCITFLMPHPPDCPACRNQLGGPLGTFCPECASQSVRSGGPFGPPCCDSCGSTLGAGKHHRPKIHACTHCGLWLDEKGL